VAPFSGHGVQCYTSEAHKEHDYITTQPCVDTFLLWSI